MALDWQKWHEAYDQPGSLLARRLAVVQGFLRDALGSRPPGRIRAISVCAGEGRDLLGVLRDHPRAPDVKARLVEQDPRLAARASASAPAGVEVVCGDASLASAYEGAVPADLVLVCGVFGNVSDADVERTVRALPSLCAEGAAVVWTRHRRPPDLTVHVRRWLAEAGFEELAFEAPGDHPFGVGLCRLVAAPAAFRPGERLFTFVGFDALG